LVLYGTFASVKSEPWSVPRELYEQFLRETETHWGEGIVLAVNAPSALGDKAMVQRVAQLERASASPGSILALLRANYELDVRRPNRIGSLRRCFSLISLGRPIMPRP